MSKGTARRRQERVEKTVGAAFSIYDGRLDMDGALGDLIRS